MTGLKKAIAAAGLAMAVPVSAPAQQAATATAEPAAAFELSVSNIMRGPEHVGTQPSDVTWTEDGRWIYFRWQPGGQAWDEPTGLYRVPATGGTPERLPDEEEESAAILLAAGDVSPDERWKVVAHRGDVYLLDRRSLDMRQLTETRAEDSSPVFRRDGRAIYFVRDDNLFELELERASLKQLTDIRAEREEREEPPAPQREFLEEQQLELFEAIRREKRREERAEERREAREAAAPPVVRIDPEERVQRLAVEPGGRYLVLEVGRPAEDARQTVVPG
jgi:dipeptidyl aminopeptidase/acylaminoacyl peptidase